MAEFEEDLFSDAQSFLLQQLMEGTVGVGESGGDLEYTEFRDHANQYILNNFCNSISPLKLDDHRGANTYYI